MFGYLAGIGSKQWRDKMRDLYETRHMGHTERVGDCALCETEHMMSIIGLVASPLYRLPLRAKRFRNTGRKHKR